MDHLFLDTDVILDLITDRVPFSDHIAVIFEMARRKEISVFTSALTLSNAYYILRKWGTHKKILDQFRKFSLILEYTEFNREIVHNALQSTFPDFEDALQNYSAEYQKKVNIILTRNTKDFKHSSLSVMTPEMYLKTKNPV